MLEERGRSVGLVAANADATVFREIPNCLVIARPDSPSDRCTRRIAAQSSTVITLLIVEEWPTIRLQHVAEYWAADETKPWSCGPTVGFGPTGGGTSCPRPL